MGPLRENQRTRGPVDNTSLRAAISTENAGVLLRVVLNDNETLADRLGRVADAFADLDHQDRIALGSRFYLLSETLIQIEHYHAGRQGVILDG